MTAITKPLLSIADLNLTQQCAEGHEFEFLDTNGKGTGFYLTVIGAHAPEVQSWANKQLNQRRRQEALNRKRGKAEEYTPIEDDIEFGVEFMAIRIKGWRGIKEEYSPELALTICENNPMIVEQVKTESENIANFTKSK